MSPAGDRPVDTSIEPDPTPFLISAPYLVLNFREQTLEQPTFVGTQSNVSLGDGQQGEVLLFIHQAQRKAIRQRCVVNAQMAPERVVDVGGAQEKPVV